MLVTKVARWERFGSEDGVVVGALGMDLGIVSLKHSWVVAPHGIRLLTLLDPFKAAGSIIFWLTFEVDMFEADSEWLVCGGLLLVELCM